MPRIFWRGRGRMAGRGESASKRRKILEYLAVLAVKYNIDANEFLNCIVEAWNQEESKCEQVNVWCRERTRDRAIFLGMKKASLKARVLEIPEPNRVYTRHGTEAYVTNALIGDETGTIRMNLWNRQINMVSQGDLIKIENGTVARFRGERQLRIGKHGKITVVQDAESFAS